MLAPKINHRSFKHLSFIVERNKVVSWGTNDMWKTHPLALKFGHRHSCIHSELAAILDFPYPVVELVNYEMVNVRIKNSGELGNSTPCRFCKQMLQWFGMEKVTYFNAEGRWERFDS